MIRVLIADHHPVVVQGLKSILAKADTSVVFGEAASGLQAFQMVRNGRWDVLVFDIAMPGRNSGMALLRELRRTTSRTPVLVFSACSEEPYGMLAFKAGAAGYVNKTAPPEEVLTAVRKVAAGGKYVSPAMAEIMVERFDSYDQRNPHDCLSARETEVFLAFADGRGSSEIARDLALSAKTVSTYRARLLRKLNLASNTQLVHYAIQYGLVVSPGPLYGEDQRRSMLTGQGRPFLQPAATGNYTRARKRLLS